MCVEAKPPYNSAVCPVGFQFNLKVSIQGENDGKLLHFNSCLLMSLTFWSLFVVEALQNNTIDRFIVNFDRKIIYLNSFSQFITNCIIIFSAASVLGTGDDYITMTVEQCAIQKCVLVPVNISAINQLSINLEPPDNHDNRIELVDVKHNITILSAFGKNPRGCQVHINLNYKTTLPSTMHK